MVRKPLTIPYSDAVRCKISLVALERNFPSMVLHMATSMTLIVVPYIDDVIIAGDMIGGKTHRLDVSIGNETSHISSCFRRSMGNYMDATLYHLFPYEVSHMVELSLWEEPLMSMWEDFFYELPFWRVIHFIWMIAWRLGLHMGMKVP